MKMIVAMMLVVAFQLFTVSAQAEVVDSHTSKDDSSGVFIQAGQDTYLSRMIFTFGWDTWADVLGGDRFAYRVHGTFGFFPTHDSYPNLSLGAGFGFGTRNKFMLGPFLDAGIAFKETKPTLLLQTGLTLSLYAGLVGVGGNWGRVGLVTDFGTTFMPMDNSYKPFNGMIWRVGVLIPY